MRLTIGVRSVLCCERIETCWSDFKYFNVKFYARALVGVIIKVILQNARCNNKERRLYICQDINLTPKTLITDVLSLRKLHFELTVVTKCNSSMYQRNVYLSPYCRIHLC